MDTETQAPPLDAAVAEMERRWRASGIPGLYAGGNGPVSRERARNIRSLLYPKPDLPTGRLERVTIAGPNGPIPVETVWPVAGEPIGTLVYYHGGGWIIGDIDSHQAHAIRIANRARVAVLNVDYRLAPEHPFPQGVDDALAAVQWAAKNLGRLGGAGKPLAVGGDSAGGNFAAVAALACRDQGIALEAQMLIYPATDMTGLGDPDIRQAYFAGHFERDCRNPKASPLFARLDGVAPAILGVGPHDFLYKDNLAYAAALRAAKVPLVFREFPTLNHGFFSYTAISPACAAAADRLCDDLRELMTRGSRTLP
ncbi:MAG: alpha/beta hydrolase [Reyranellaceae bacterium]